MRRTVIAALLAGAAAVSLAACGGSSTGAAQGPNMPQTYGGSTSAQPSTSAVPSSVGPTSTPTSTAPTSTAPTPKPTPTHVGLQEGDKGPAVLAMQQRLLSLGYWLSSADGSFGDSTQQAVYALQKAAGLSRDGAAGPATMAALNAGVRPTIRSTGASHRIEIQKDTQLLLIIDGGKITTILNTSTGSGATFSLNGTPTKALTPSGTYHVFRQVDAEDPGPLGALWRPKYFNGGIAVHGLGSVPPYAASHGCARVSDAAMDMIWASNLLPIGTQVTVL